MLVAARNNPSKQFNNAGGRDDFCLQKRKALASVGKESKLLMRQESELTEAAVPTQRTARRAQHKVPWSATLGRFESKREQHHAETEKRRLRERQRAVVEEAERASAEEAAGAAGVAVLPAALESVPAEQRQQEEGGEGVDTDKEAAMQSRGRSDWKQRRNLAAGKSACTAPATAGWTSEPIPGANARLSANDGSSKQSSCVLL